MIIDNLLNLTLLVLVAIMVFKNINMSFKIGYYEQKFRLNKDKFSKEEFEKIEDMMKRKNPF